MHSITQEHNTFVRQSDKVAESRDGFYPGLGMAILLKNAIDEDGPGQTFARPNM